MLQSKDELEKWHTQEDPWQYESSPEDVNRKNVLLSEIPVREYSRVLDIGCGQGFITRDLPGKTILGVDISQEAINKARQYETEKLRFIQSSIFDLNKNICEQFDLIVITGVLYPQYIGNSLNLVYSIVDDLLCNSGILVSVHINDWYRARFPYLLLKEYFYPYKEYTHRLEVYVK